MSDGNVSANNEQFYIKIDGVSARLRLLSLHGEEHISKLFAYTVTFAIKGDLDIDPRDVLGKAALVEIHDEYASVARYVSGIVSSIKQSDYDDKFIKYDVEITPDHVKLGFRKDYRIFQEKTLEDIIRQVMKEASFPSDTFRFELSESHSAREYCVQFGETDLQFIERLMEEEGTYYYYEHKEDAHVMVIADHPSTHTPISGDKELAFHEMTGMVSQGEYVTKITHKESIGSGGYVTSDYNYLRPTQLLLKEKQAKTDQELSIYEYPGAYADSATGELKARYHIEGLKSSKQRFEGHATTRRLASGRYFTLTKHPRDRYNQDYLLVVVNLTCTQPGVLEEAAGGAPTTFTSEFVSIPLSETFRSHKNTSKPRVYGVQTAVVVGTEGEEIYTDEFGRVKIQFHWDRVGKKDGNSSCWVRVSQAWAGEGWGAMFIPRIGHEVLVSFVDGDPDRPVITGKVYHGDNMPPYALPKEKNKSTIKSNSTKGGGGSNEFRFDDTKDAEEIFIHGQKDWTIVIENDKHQSVGHDETFDISNDRTKSVGNNQSESIGKNKTITVGDNHSESIGKNADISVGGNNSLAVGGNLSESVGKSQNSDVAKNLSLNVGDDGNISYGKKLTESIGKDRTLKIGDNDKISIGKDLSIMVGKKAVISVDDELTLKCGSASIILKKSGKIQIKGSDIDVKGSGNVVIKGSKIAQN